MSKSKPYLYFVSVLCVISLILPLFTAAAFPGGVKAEEPGVVNVSFDSFEDINENFISYYFDEPLSWRPGHAGQRVELTDVWKLENQCLINNNDSSDQSQMMGMSQLLYKTPYKNFELNIDFLYAANGTWISPIVGFGAQPGQFVTDADGIDAVYLADGIKPYFWGTGIENVGRNNHTDGFDYTLMYKALPINAADWHHMRLVVQDSTIAMYIDNYGPYFATDFSYKGGHIFLASCHGKGGFKNMTIKALPDTEMQGLLIGDDAAAKFENYYAAGAADTVPGEFAETAFDTNWELKDGTLIRKADADNGWLSNMAMLTYKERKYMNFSLEVDYYQSPYSASWAMVGFGAKETDEFYYKSETSTLAYTTQEGRRVLRGKGLAGVSEEGWYALEIESVSEYGYPNNDKPRWHHMKLVVQEGRARMYIDGSSDYAEAILPDSYEGGYIYLAAGANQARFRNLTVTPLEGDVNGDGNVDILDLIKSKKYIAGVAALTDTEFRSVDLDGSGNVGSEDLVILRKKLLGIHTPYRSEKTDF